MHTPANFTIEQQDIGVMGTGSNMFRSGIVHSSGRVFIGTYGPQPAMVWQYDPATQALTRVGTPGEYQLDSMVEAPNGKIYIGTAYNGLVYELDPETGSIRDLGTPPIDTVPWIFTMICTRDGEIYGAKGVGLFHLDWRTGKMESCGVVPGPHDVPGIVTGAVTRTLEERPDGVLWGDTNRWLYTFDPRTREITPVADIVALDDACYAVIHALGKSPVMDVYFQVYSRFTGRVPKHKFFVCRTATGAIEPLHIDGLDGFTWINSWWHDGEASRLLITHLAPEEVRGTIAVVDVEKQQVVERWTVDTNDRPPQRIPGGHLWFTSLARGTLYKADPERKHLDVMATNPVPTECRCLAASPDGRLGTDTYDCGFAFTRRIDSETFTDHGPVWIDDHRCNYGPAVFAGEQGRYLLANHGENVEVSKLWVTDVETNRHWRVGPSVLQLVRFKDGTVWGTLGANPPWLHFDESICWTPAWQSRPGTLFRYKAGAEQVEIYEAAGEVGALAELPGGSGQLVFGFENKLCVYDTNHYQVTDVTTLPSPILAVTADYRGQQVWVVLEDGAVWGCEAATEEEITATQRAKGFGSVNRGCFVLPQSGYLIGVGSDGLVSVFDPATGSVSTIPGPVPLPAGPAVDPVEDAWYSVDRRVVKYWLNDREVHSSQ